MVYIFNIKKFLIFILEIMNEEALGFTNESTWPPSTSDPSLVANLRDMVWSPLRREFTEEEKDFLARLVVEKGDEAPVAATHFFNRPLLDILPYMKEAIKRAERIKEDERIDTIKDTSNFTYIVDEVKRRRMAKQIKLPIPVAEFISQFRDPNKQEQTIN